MQVRTQLEVPHPVLIKAKSYVEQKSIPFFDFFRDMVFGFVAVADRKGYYPHAIYSDKGELETFCSCKEAKPGELCSHGLALFMRSINWPNERIVLTRKFDNYPLSRFFQTVGRNIYKTDLLTSGNPRLTVPEGVLDTRMLNYLGFGDGSGKQAERDRECLEDAKEIVRTYSELNMMSNGFPSARVLFEESSLYPLCKLLFLLQVHSPLQIRVNLAEDHQVALDIQLAGEPLFHWLMPIDLFTKGLQKDREFWEPLMSFEIQSNSVQLTYRCHFLENNDLEIEPMVCLSDDVHVPLHEVQIANRSLCYHEAMGYFHTQIGLSPFEMQYSQPGTHLISYKKVKKFLVEHRDTLEGMDRSLMDDSLFGEVVVIQFDRIILNLMNFSENAFRFKLEAQLGEHTYSIADLLERFQERGRYINIGGKVFDTTGYDAIYLKPILEAGVGSGVLDMASLFRFLTFFKGRVQVETNELTAEVFERLRDMSTLTPPELADTNLSLRPYQETGYAWLYFLRKHGLGGLLCDQMGLGKTHQGMALLAAAVKENPDARHLVVAPASVLFHWKDKLKTFCPGIRATIYHGTERDADRDLRKYQVLLTSYGTLRNDAERFADHLFDLILFDEIQNLKNSSTKSYRQITQLRGLCRIGLTGTPIENQVFELKALMDLVFPGYMGSNSDFKRYFADPIQTFNKKHARERLHDIVFPFVLRRNKKEVLQELPEKVEDLRLLEFSPYEFDLYKDVATRGRKALTGLVERSPQFMHVFQLIDQLKKVCNHPALYFGNTDYAAYPSTKWDTFTELLQEVMDSGEKLVVFTQFLGMVDIFRRFLTERGIGHAVLTGKTAQKNRETEQRRFQEDPNCRVFVGSILAAGTGIDLTAGSVLIHYDRWWNAAREEQATDRIHRIGQKSNVQIYKFRALETVEDRIDAIIQRKRLLLDDLVGFDDEQLTKRLSLEELLEILG
ncbi:DEAD/DEAH box helicase [Sulfidibacter corallicola]|uniref:DEAD/DEAH box helicase n=1 Tax=Sulfidibacter corallicola TaxID=2818388 RepID=A0A8A4TWA1_SULCO|nr:DEAD/DEAH box helicase [Sulfidibacter corallicola]QTD53770.1 DEAD/DEAH box helicase [Sulfidibacter corallicola]